MEVTDDKTSFPLPFLISACTFIYTITEMQTIYPRNPNHPEHDKIQNVPTILSAMIVGVMLKPGKVYLLLFSL